MAKISQDFTAYSGDDAYLPFTVVDSTGTAIDISLVSDILWNLRRDLQTAVALQLKKTGGEIVFTSDGSDGKFRVRLTAAQTQVLFGYYMHEAQIVDAAGNVTTISLGTATFGRSPASTYSGDPSISDKDAVRYWLHDTDSSNWRLSDPEILYTLTLYPDPLRAAAQCARSLASRYAGRASKRVGDLSISYGEVSRQYLDLASALEMKANISGITGPYAGGISISDRDTVNGDTDRAPPPFQENQFDNQPGPNPSPVDPWQYR